MYRLQKSIVGLSIVTLLAMPIWAEAAEKPSGSESTIHYDAAMTRINPSKKGWTELMEAVRNGDLAEVNLLLEKGVDVNAKYNGDTTALMIAANFGNLKIVKALVNKGADVNIQNNDGKTALSCALGWRHINIVQYLLEKGTKDDNALFMAVAGGYTSIVDGLLKSVIDINNLRNKDAMTLLVSAAKGGHTDIVKTLLNKGAGVNIRGKGGITPLMAAAKGGHTDIVDVLLNKRADVNIQDEDGMTALMNAVEEGHTDTVQVLLAHGADANVRDKKGRSPLTLIEAAEGKQNMMIKALLTPGAGVNAKDSSGATALIYAAQEGLEDVVKTLLQNGADVKIKDNEGLTALTYAEAGGYKNIVKMLLKGQTPPAKAVSLLYIQQGKDGCHIKTWEPSTQTTKDLYALKDCPKDVYVDERTATIFIITDTAIQEIVFKPTVVTKTPVEIPFKIGEVKVDGEQRWNHLGQIGYLKNGRLAAVNDRQRPADDSDKLLYEFNKGKWTLVKQRYCDRFEDCSIDDISGRHWSVWRTETQIWHPMLSLNPFIIDRGKARGTSGQLFAKRGHGNLKYIKLSVNGHNSILYYNTEEGDMSFGLYTFSVYLKTYKDNKPIEISNVQCSTSVEYKYLLLNKYFGEGLELIDLETGERVLKDLKFAFWMY